MSKRELVGVVEAAYRLDLDDMTWIDRVTHAAAPLLDAGQGVAGYLIDTRAPQAAHTPVLVGRDPWRGGWREQWWDARVSRMPSRLVAELAGFGSPTFASQSCGAVVRGAVVARLADGLPAMPLPPGVVEGFIISGYDALGCGAVLFAFRSEGTTNASNTSAWERVSGHLAAACRLRAQHRRTRVGVARRAKRTITRAREHADLAAWSVLHDDATLVPDGGDYLAYENAPTQLALPTLTPRERAAVALLDLGRSNKAIAYELGIAPSTASTLLSSAAKKLGVRGARDLIARTRALVHAPPTTSLTEGEATVMALLLSGLPDKAIADARGTARSTVTKQIDAIYKKLGVGSRRELVARFSSFAPWTKPWPASDNAA